MNYSTVNFTSETSTNFTSHTFWLKDRSVIILDSIGLLVGLPTHCYVIWLIIKGTGNGVASEFFNLNLSVCEIGNCLSNLLYILNNYILFPQFKILTWFLLGLSIAGHPLFQCLICVERYLAVVHPVTFLKFKPLRYRVICCTVAWIITFGSCLLCVFTNISYNIINTWFYAIQFALYFYIQLFCLVAVLRALKQSGPGERGRERNEENHMKRRAFYLILITTMTMIITYLPFIISGFFFILSPQFMVDMFSYGLFGFVLGGFVQPVFYLHRTGKLSCFCYSNNNI